MIVRKLRLQRGWSQEQLAEMTGLSVRTIQRIERGQNAGLESLNALAAVFEVDLSELNISEAQQENAMTNEETNMTYEEMRTIEHVRDIKAFYFHLLSFVIVIPILIAVNVYLTPQYLWFWWATLGWGLGVLSHGLAVFEVFGFFGTDWERRQVEKRLGRRL